MDEAARAALDLRKQVVYLCDGPPDWNFVGTCVVFASPNEALLKTTRKFQQTYYMPVWTLEELCEAASVLDLPISKSGPTADSDSEQNVFAERDERIAEIQTRFEIFGGEPRFCLHPNPAQVALAAMKLEGAIDTTGDLETLATLFKGEASEKVRHRLLHYEPQDDTYAIKKTQLASAHVKKKLAEKLLARYRSERGYLRSTLRSIPGAASLYELVFEMETHEALHRGPMLMLRRLAPTGVTQVQLFPLKATAPPVAEFNAVSNTMLTGGPYHKLKSKVLESIDAFYLPTMAGKAPLDPHSVVQWNEQHRILLFQITASATHDVNVVGIIHVLERLGLLESVAAHPERAVLVFIVPRDTIDELKSQQIVVPEATGSNVITGIRGIGDSAASDLVRYGIRTVEELQTQIEAFDQQNETFKIEPAHTESWMQVYKCGVNHALTSASDQFGKVIAAIPQYACALEEIV